MNKITKEPQNAELSKHSRMQINDTKAGMENIDKEKINSIIKKHSQKSRFYQKQQIKENELKAKAQEKLNSYKSLTGSEIQSAQNKADLFIAQLESQRSFARTLVHIDMDAFYANVEIKDNPSLRDKPMAVGSDSMLSTSNYIARKFGIRAAMPGFIARELCPELIIVPCNHSKYQKESAEVMKIVSEYDPNYSAASLDEAYIDLTEYLKTRDRLEISRRTFPKEENQSETITFGNSAEEIVKELRHRIYLTTKLTASAGISSNLRLAKLCSDINKPNGQFTLENDLNRIINFLNDLPIRKVNGIGPSTALLLDCYGIKICRDLIEKRALIYLLETQNTFDFLISACRGFGGNIIENESDRKSLGHETTFSAKLSNNKEEFLKTLKTLSEEISSELNGENLLTLKVNIKIKTTSFEVYTRTKSLNAYTSDAEEIYQAAKYLLVTEYNNSKGKLRLRLIGVRVTSLKDKKSIEESKEDVKLNTKKLKNKENRIDSFFNVKDKNETNLIKMEEMEYDETESINDLGFEIITGKCPFCEILIEGNKDYFYLHLNLCMKEIEQCNNQLNLFEKFSIEKT